MATKYLDSNGLLYLWQKIRNTFVSNITWDSTNHKLVQKKKTGTNGAEQNTDIVTLANVATSGSYNDLSNKPTIPTLKNVFGKVKVGATTIEADTTQDTLELVAGSNVTLTPDATNDKVTIAATDTTYSAATTSADGLMSSTDKSKLDGIATGAEVNVQSDWSQSDSTADDYIKNKPTIPTPEVFIAEYGTTTFTEITNAVTAGKEVLVLRENSSITYYAQLTFYSALEIYFSCYQRLNTGRNQVSWFKITSSGAWSYGSKEIVTPDGTQDLTNKTYNGYTLGDACAKGVVTSISADSANLPTVTAVKNYVASAITGAAAFQGTAPTTFAPTDYKAGYYWVIGTAGTYAGQTCEPGDMIFAIADGTTYSASDFDVVQTNLDITSITNGEIDTIVAS